MSGQEKKRPDDVVPDMNRSAWSQAVSTSCHRLAFRQAPFPIGDTPPAFLHRLAEFCQRWSDGLNSLAWPVFRGLTVASSAASSLLAATSEFQLGPYYSPLQRWCSLRRSPSIFPPAEFVTAVMTAPMPGTSEYTEAVAACGGPIAAAKRYVGKCLTTECTQAVVVRVYDFPSRLPQPRVLGDRRRKMSRCQYCSACWCLKSRPRL